MTTPVLAPPTFDPAPPTEPTPAERIYPGHVIDFFGSDFRVSHLKALRGPLVGMELLPSRRIAVAVDGRELTLLPEQEIPVRVPTTEYRLQVFGVRGSLEAYTEIRIAAETERVAEEVALRYLVNVEGLWADVRATDGEYVLTVAVSR